MKKIIAASAVLAAFLGIFLGVTQAANAVPLTCVDGTVLVTGNTATVSNDPDSGNHGDWAVDNFTRTTDVKVLNCLNQTYQVIVRDSGTFTTKPDGPSPRQNLPLPSTSFTGTFTGGTTYTVTSSQPPYSPIIAPISGSPDTADWWTRFFHSTSPKVTPDSVSDGWVLKGSEDAFFSWTYKTACERWIDSNTDGDGANKSAGDITGKICKVKTPPPTTTTSALPTTTTTAPPATTTGSSLAGSIGGTVTPTTTIQQVATVPVGAPETGGGATAGIQEEWLLFLAGALLLAGGGVVLYTLRRRPQTQK